jgi:hypothetical protein
MKSKKARWGITALIYDSLVFLIGSGVVIAKGFNPQYISFCIFTAVLATSICGSIIGVSFLTDFLKTWKYNPILDKDNDEETKVKYGYGKTDLK